MILVPLVILGGAELGLRLAGYGYATSFFLPTRINGHDFYVPNAKFTFRFFSARLARPSLPIRMAADKSTNAYRIFLFGESAANGDPDPTFGMGRYLQVLLGEPGKVVALEEGQIAQFAAQRLGEIGAAGQFCQ